MVQSTVFPEGGFRCRALRVGWLKLAWDGSAPNDRLLFFFGGGGMGHIIIFEKSN